MSNFIWFSNGEKKFSISSDLLPQKMKCKTKRLFFIDMDTNNVRNLFNFFRNGRINATEQVLRDEKAADINRQKITINVGGEMFYTSKETLQTIPYFKGLYNFQTKNTFQIDRDPVLFRELLTVIRHGKENVSNELLEEVEFWGITKTVFNSDFLRFKFGIAELPLISAPEIDFLSEKEKQWSKNQFFSPVSYDTHSLPQHEYLRTHATEKRVQHWLKEQESNGLSQWVLRSSCNAFGKSFLIFETDQEIFQITEVFKYVQFSCGPYVISQTSAFMTVLSKIHEQKSFTVEKHGLKYIVCVPLLFPFCLNLCDCFPNTNATAAWRKVLNVQSNKVLKVIGSAGYRLDKESEKIYSNGEFDRLQTEFLALGTEILPDDDGNVKFTPDSFDNGVAIQAIYILAKKENLVVNCKLFGEICVREACIAPISIMHNQMNQLEQTPHQSYDPSLWILSMSATNLTSTQPYCYFFLPKQEPLHINFKVLDKCDTKLVFEIWMSFYVELGTRMYGITPSIAYMQPPYDKITHYENVVK